MSARASRNRPDAIPYVLAKISKAREHCSVEAVCVCTLSFSGATTFCIKVEEEECEVFISGIQAVGSSQCSFDLLDGDNGVIHPKSSPPPLRSSIYHGLLLPN